MLNELFYGIQLQSVIGSTNRPVKCLETDSRKVVPEACFIAIVGHALDGHQYIREAVERGATSVVCQQLPDECKDGVTYVLVRDTAEAAGIMSHHFYGKPSHQLKVVGVTGTNGKTTVATLLWKLFTSMGHTCGLISTVENRIGAAILPSTHTTPDAITLHALIKQMADQGCSHVFMECSSHAIHQKRIAGVEFTGALFTNITHDHLDYHQTFDAYINVKKSWFDKLSASAFAISNADDRRGAVMLQNTAAKKLFYSLKTLADYKGKILDNSLHGLHLNIQDQEVHFRLIGAFNAYNLLLVYATAVNLGKASFEVLQHLSNLNGAEGRFDHLVSEKEQVIGIVDYAHTPDALLNVLATIQHLRQDNQQVITVVGCGGNRDAAKRPIMAEVACQHSDQIILTSDNPRNEDPDSILDDMEKGVNVVCRKKTIRIADRREAIKTAIRMSRPKDIVLIAGKGHEKYQEIRGVKHPFDDRAMLEEMFQLLEK
jgi:UDP-N-acetylmuramoyl-L-alanyl-D-glutamate--2,6-diaminopimelate ligase